MKLRKEFYVKGKLWRLEYKWRLTDKASGEAFLGLCDKANRTIYIDRSIDKETKWIVFLHELCHAAIFESHSNDTSLTSDVEEVIAGSVADVFSSNFIMRWKRGTQ